MEKIISIIPVVLLWILTVISFVYSSEKVCRKLNKGYGEFKIKEICRKYTKQSVEYLVCSVAATILAVLMLKE